MKTKSVHFSDLLLGKISDIGVLVKFKLTMMVVMSSIGAYVVMAGTSFSWSVATLLFFGGFLVSGAANALNQVLEKEFDALMDRTKERPLVTGRMKSNHAVLIAGIFSLLGVSFLALINPLTGFLSMLSLLLYAFLYTPIKRHSTLAVAIGAIPGALPVLIGSTAFSGSLTILGLLLFAIQFLWQFPHFWAIGYLSREDYDKAGFKLLPIEDGEIDRSLGMHASLYALLLLIVVCFLTIAQVSILALILSIVLSTIYLICSLNFHFKFDRKSALILMFSSFFYLPLILLTLILV